MALPEEARPSLRGADLIRANLSGVNLRGADLRWSSLRGVNLSGSSLRGVNLRGADLSGTGCLLMQYGPWMVWITPEDMAIGRKRFTHAVWRNATDAEIAAMEHRAAEIWSHWKTMLLAACEACAKHGWPKKEDAE
jgi:hypothetical protein